jgi:subtilisin family serine protease
VEKGVIKMKFRKLPIIFIVLVMFTIHFGISCERESEDILWLDAIHEQGRKLFYQTIGDKITAHPKRSQLTETEIKKVMEAEIRYERLYGLLINIFYQKDEPVFKALIEDGSKESKSRFRRMYLELARFSAHKFIECFFISGPDLDYFIGLQSRFKGKDKVDLVIMSTGYFSRLDIPESEKTVKHLDPEFDRQWGLDAGRFRAAHKITKGKGVKVAVLDSGIDMTHPVFRDTTWGKHFSIIGREGKPWATEAPLVDWGWHGTNVCSVVARYSPEVQITMYKDSDADTQNNSPYPLLLECSLAASIYKAVHDGNDVINISAGSNVGVDYLKEACQYAYDNNVIIVVASTYYLGKYLGFNKTLPSQYDTTIAVTGIEQRDKGKYGHWEIAAPDITNTVGAPIGTFCASPYYVNEKDRYGPSTSLAAPVVSSLVALTIAAYPRSGTEGPGEYFETIKKLLINNADSEAVGFRGFSPECGYGLVDAEKTVKAALLVKTKRLDKYNFKKEWAFDVANFEKAHQVTKGKGIKIALIDSSADEKTGHGISMSSIVSYFAPKAKVSIYEVGSYQNSPYPFWPAMFVSQAVYKAVNDKANVIIITSGFKRDFKFLRDACQFAFDNNVIIVAPNNHSIPGDPGKASYFPAHYNTTIAVVGVIPDKRNKPVFLNESVISHYTSVAAPALIVDFGVKEPVSTGGHSDGGYSGAAAVAGSLTALISSKISKTENELSGQYFQRIYDILTKSANPAPVGFKSFTTKAGYGLIDAGKSVGQGLKIYLEKMRKIDENFKKRLKERQKQEEEK